MPINSAQSFAAVTSPTAASKRASPSMVHSPLSAATSASRTVTICCCIQVQYEGGNRRCSRTVLWLIIVTSLISVFSVATVLLSYYSVDLFQPRTRGGKSVFKKLNGAFAPLSDIDADSWLTAVLSIPSDAANRIDPEAALGLFPSGFEGPASVQEYLVAASKWSNEHLAQSSPRVFQPYGTEFVTARGMFPDARAVVLLNSWPSGSIKAPCDSACKDRAAELASQSLIDLDKEGFVTSATLAKFASDSPVGVIPALLASIRAMGAQAVHMEERPSEAGLSCIKFHAQQTESAIKALTLTYCGGLDESSETQRASLRQLLRPVQPWSTLMRSANYALHPDVLGPRADLTALAHLKALILSISGLVVQDDSGIPFSVLAKHETDVAVFGAYKGLGEPELTGLKQAPATVIKALYQPTLAAWPSQGSLPFRFGYSKVIGPSTSSSAADNKFVRRPDFKGSHLIVAKKKAPN
jgi:hypothetical protein